MKTKPKCSCYGGFDCEVCNPEKYDEQHHEMTTDTPRTDACAHCGGNWEKSIQLFACESTTEWRTDLCLEREKSKKLEAEVERLQNGFQGSCYCCEPVGILNQKLEAEVEKLKTEYWFMKEALNKEIAELKSEIK